MSRMHITLRLLGTAALGLFAASASQAAPNVHVTFYNTGTLSDYKYDAPFTMLRTCDDAAGTGYAYVDLSTGTLKASAVAKDVPQFTVAVQGTDSYVIQSANSSPISITARLAATGIGLIPTNSQSLSVHVTVGQPGGANTFFARTWQATSNPTTIYDAPINQPFAISASPEFTLSVTPGVPFELYYDLRLDTRYGDSLDFSHTAQMLFDLPQDVTISSVGAYAVPEPTSILLLLPALGMIAARRRRSAGSQAG